MTLTAMITTLIASAVVVALVTNWRVAVVWTLSLIALATIHSVTLTYSIAAAMSLLGSASDTSWM